MAKRRAKTEPKEDKRGRDWFHAQGGLVSFAAEGEDDKVRFEMVPYAGQVFKRWGENMAFDMDGMKMRKKTIPAFVEHDSSRMAGVIDGLEKKNGKIVLSGYFIDTDSAREVQAAEGLDWDCSLSFPYESYVSEYVAEKASSTVNGKSFKGPGSIIRECELVETSFTYYGAVPGAGASFSSENDEEVREIFSTSIEGGQAMSENTLTQADLDAARKEGQDEVRGLFSSMQKLCPEDAGFVAEAFSGGKTIEQFKEGLLEKFRAENAELRNSAGTQPQPAAPVVPFSADEHLDDARHQAQDGQKEDFMAKVCAYSKEHGVKKAEAIKAVAFKHPDLYEQFRNQPAH